MIDAAIQHSALIRTPAEDGTQVQPREHGYRDTPVGLRAMLGCGGALTLAKFYVERGEMYRGEWHAPRLEMNSPGY